MRMRILSLLLLAGFSSAALAKLPAPVLDEAGKAKAAEAAARAAWQAKVDGFQLCKAQDKVAARFRKTGGEAGKAAVVQTAAKPAAAASGTPVAATAAIPTPCVEAGPFAYNPPAQKPLESSGAHSPTGTAASPPSVLAPSAAMAPAPAKK